MKVAVLGAGTMGHGIAHVCAMAECDVDLHDMSSQLITDGLRAIRGNLDRGVEKGKVDPAAADAAFGRINAAPNLVSAIQDADLVIEAIPEDMDLKKDIFAALSASAPATAILATNTSSLSITEIASAATQPERVIGMHFFNPPHIMKLVEIVRAKKTSDETVEAVRALAVKMGKDPIVVNDSPGFASSRLGVLLGIEAIRMLEAGVGAAEDIDKAMEVGYRHPMGPLRLTDLVGLDVRLSIAEHLYKEVGEQFRPPELLRKMVAAGKLGKKSGEGFYKWNGSS